MEIIVNRIEELSLAAKRVLDAVGERRVVAFHGEMGAGKTTLIKSLCAALGTDSIVNSPTFAIVNDYEVGSDESIYHFDFYRVKDVREAMDMGCEEYFYSGCYCFIEWPDVVKELLPAEIAEISIRVEGETRIISVI